MPNPVISFRLSNYQLAIALKILKSLEPNIHPLSKSAIVKTIFHDWIAKHSFAKATDISVQDYTELEQLTANRQKTIKLSDFQQIMSNTEITKKLNKSLGIPSKQAIEAFQQAEWDKVKAEQPKQSKEQTPPSASNNLNEEQIEEQINEQIALAQQYSINDPEPPSEPTPQTEQPSSPSTQPTSTNPLTSDQPTESTINTVTDFSPPSDLLDQSE